QTSRGRRSWYGDAIAVAQPLPSFFPPYETSSRPTVLRLVTTFSPTVSGGGGLASFSRAIWHSYLPFGPRECQLLRDRWRFMFQAMTLTRCRPPLHMP